MADNNAHSPAAAPLEPTSAHVAIASPMNTHVAISSPKNAYVAVASPLSDHGHPPRKSEAVKEPTTPVAVAIDVSQPDTREPLPSTGVGILSGKWSTGLFNCFDFCVPNCLMATFCPCISVAQIATRIGFQYSTVLLVFGVAVGLEYLMYGLRSATGMSLWGYVAYLLSIALFLAFWQLRTKVRQQFELPGSCVEDFFVSWCCSCCSIAQMATHVKSYTPGGCGFGPPDELPGYDAEK